MPKTTFINLSETKKIAFKRQIYELFSKHAYEDIGIRDIANATGIAIGSFYRYFTDKDSMYLDFFSEIEEKLMSYFDTKNDSLLAVQNKKDFSKVLTIEENNFGETWFNAPNMVLYKFYFEGYIDKLHENYLDIFINLEQKGKLAKGIDAMFAFYYYKTAYFNMLIYLRENSIKDHKTIFNLRRHFHQQVVLRGVLTEQAFKEMYRELEIKIQL